ncbi:MAG: hypothetical protein Q4G05_03665 [Clostridia bacterium]|nr:hypothetical protein [Clostridia bacterium]
MVKKLCLIFLFIAIICGISIVSNAAETPILDTTPYPNSEPRNDFFANGTPITITEKVGGGVTITWTGGSMDVVSGTRIFGGGNEGKSYTTSNIVMNSGTVSHIYGGGRGSVSQTSNVDTANITINGGTISKSIYGGGALSSRVKNTKIVVNAGQIANINGRRISF